MWEVIHLGAKVPKGSSSWPLERAWAWECVPEADNSNDHNSHHEDKPSRGGTHDEGELLLELLGTGAWRPGGHW